MKKYWKSAVGLCVAASLLFSLPVYAETEAAGDYDAESLGDNRLEYGEIEDRIVNFSPTYLSLKQTMSKNYSSFETAIAEVKSLNSGNRSDLSKAKKDGAEEEIAYLSGMIGAGEKMVKDYEKTVKMIKGSTDRTLNTSVKGSLVSTAQTLMISYHRLVSAAELMDASAELSQLAYESAVTQRGLNMVTDNDVLTAEESLLSVKAQQENMKKQLAQVQQNLYMLAGWSYDADVEIAPVPEPDQNRIAAIDVLSDIGKAIGNNYSLSEVRHTSASGLSVSGKRDRLAQMEEMETRITLGVNQTYQSLLTSQKAFEAASSAYQSTQLTYEGAQRQYQLGMLSPLQYKQMSVLFLTQKMNYDNAKYDLFQAMETYDWAIKGQLSLE